MNPNSPDPQSQGPVHTFVDHQTLSTLSLEAQKCLHLSKEDNILSSSLLGQAEATFKPQLIHLNSADPQSHGLVHTFVDHQPSNTFPRGLEATKPVKRG